MTHTAMSSPGVRFPPPLIFVAAFFAGWYLNHAARALPVPGVGASPVHVVGVVLAIVGFALGAWGIATFRRARTAIVPFHPASRLVETGPYRFTRNPMYTGLTIAYLGGAAILDSLWLVVLLPFVLIALMQLVVKHEEAYLGQAFGAEYDAYRRRVRRFL